MLIRFNQILSQDQMSSVVGNYHEYLQEEYTRVNPKRYLDTMRVLLMNILSKEGSRGVDVSTGKDTFYPSIRRYNKYRVSRRLLLVALKWLKSQGLVTVERGVSGKHYTTVLPTFKLLRLAREEGSILFDPTKEECILLRNDKKHIIPYSDTDHTSPMRDRLIKYNTLLADTEVVDGNGTLLTNHYVRIFNNSFRKGGRFYRADIQLIKGVDREKVTINGSKSAELDYKSLHPCLILAECGKEMDYNPYGFVEDRKLGKKILNTLLNADSRRTACNAVQGALKEYQYSAIAKDVIAATEAHNPLLVDYFFSSHGLIQMYNESCIADGIISDFVKQGKPILCIHDSFMCKEEDVDFLEDRMVYWFRKVCGNENMTVNIDRRF